MTRQHAGQTAKPGTEKPDLACRGAVATMSRLHADKKFGRVGANGEDNTANMQS